MESQYLINADEQFSGAILTALRKVPFTELNQPLYHFTDVNGLQGILNTRSLWASLATSLEDTSEIKYALELAKKILQQSLVSGNSTFLNEVIPFLNPGNSLIENTLGLKTYVVSFRKNVNESAHWKKYGREGKGFAIAFALKPLIIPGILPLPVLYDTTAQEKLLRDFIDSNAKLYAKLKNKCPHENLLALRLRAIQLTAYGLWTLAPVLKDPHLYSDEEEWRLIVFDYENVQTQYGTGLSKDVKIRHCNGRDIPFKVLQYDRLPIVHLELGAYAAYTENDDTLKQLLKKASGNEVPIHRSHIRVDHE
jgi:hypothetical protein